MASLVVGIEFWSFFQLLFVMDPHELTILYRVGSILDFSFDIDIDTGQKTSDSISIFLISVESVKFQWMSEKKHLAVGWGKI